MSRRGTQHHPDLASAVAAAVRTAGRQGRPQWVSASFPTAPCDGLGLFAAATASNGASAGARSEAEPSALLQSFAERFFWERPAEARQIVALGAAHAIETQGPERFAAAARAARALGDDLQLVAEDEAAQREPLLVGGFAFGDAAAGAEWAAFPPGRLVLPELLLTRSGEQTRCSVTRRIEPGTDPRHELRRTRDRVAAARVLLARALPPSEPSPAQTPEFRAVADAPHELYRSRVKEALRAIAAGDLEKVVLARAVRLISAADFPVASILDTLRRANPACASFAVARPGGTFLGATPERLVRVEGRRVESSAVAGSARRGRSPEEDARLARELCESKKEQAEHAVVVRALRDALAEACVELDLPEAPRLLQLERIQHLETPIAGRLRSEQSALELLERLHPTPAVAGAPREAALAWLAARESLERGWYAGAVGAVYRDGGGEFCVALRAALLRGGMARLFAGAGIVAGSEPEAELRETQLKLRAMLGALVEL